MTYNTVVANVLGAAIADKETEIEEWSKQLEHHTAQASRAGEMLASATLELAVLNNHLNEYEGQRVD